jgi:hypothetical protein
VNIFEAIGMLWVIFTSALATFSIGYLAVVGLKTVAKVNINFLRKIEAPADEADDSGSIDRVEEREALKVAR